MPPTRHADSTLQFDAPDGWINRSIVVWSAPPGSAAVAPNVVVAYDRLLNGETLGGFVTRQLRDLVRTVTQFELEGQGNTTLGGRPAVELLFRWTGGPGPMKQRQVFAALADGRVASVANTAAADDFTAADEAFARVLSSLRWTA